MKHIGKVYCCIIFISALISPAIVFASGDMTSQKPIVKNINLSNSTNRLRFYPSNLRFETGKLYKLVLHNPSTQKHYFTATSFSRSVYTRKVQVLNKYKNPVAEVKGTINEIEVHPGGTTEWWFVPVKTLNTSKLVCTIKGHTEAGMIGSIIIE